MSRNRGGGLKRYMVAQDTIRAPDDPDARALLKDLIAKHPMWTTRMLRTAFKREWQAIEDIHRGE